MVLCGGGGGGILAPHALDREENECSDTEGERNPDTQSNTKPNIHTKSCSSPSLGRCGWRGPCGWRGRSCYGPGCRHSRQDGGRCVAQEEDIGAVLAAASARRSVTIAAMVPSRHDAVAQLHTGRASRCVLSMWSAQSEVATGEQLYAHWPQRFRHAASFHVGSVQPTRWKRTNLWLGLAGAHMPFE